MKPRLRGEAVLVRYCDDFVIGFEQREDAQRVAEVLGKRMERFGLRLHPEKTRLIAFERPKAGQRDGKGPSTFDFLGFTMYWRRTRHGRWQMWCKTRSKGLRRETLGRTLQLLRSERQPSKSGPSGSRHATGLAQMAASSQPAHASHIGAVQPIVGTLPASPAAGCRADMGSIATRHISGGAGWWKSPCPDLVRAG